ncbi:MarR family transcriptional regulator [Halomonas sp. Choline-3u-9]|uniref:MarR family transcriptional regulator n=1 Tax=unclassified Halomonas TaxID=2609666 RepID=UPI000484A354|nr:MULTISPECIES: MarR family transcriptional regulator [unclassified Halomonas]PKH59405.1 MarR family transcriptional regulator [Halomonas sp. Choline-3u-9]
MLTYQNPELPPEARWLVMQWALLIGPENSVESSLQTLFARLGLTYAQGRRAWGVLTGKQGDNQERFVDIERLPRQGPGRPGSRYRLSAKLVKAIATIPAHACEQHVEEINTLAKTTRLSTTDHKVGLIEGSRLRATSLSLPNRWLLMVLLAHADSPGVVTCLSVSAMRRLTGMSRYRITSQLKKLSDLGLITHHEPGRYAPHASVRKTSIYLLDLAHPLLGNGGRESVNILLPTSNSEHKRTELVDGIVDAALAAGVSSLKIAALIEEYKAIEAANRHASTEMEEATLSKEPLDRVAKVYKANVKKAQNVYHSAMELLPSSYPLEDGIEALLTAYDADDAAWLLTSVHVDAMWLLSSAWTEMIEGGVGLRDPHPEIIASIARRLGSLPNDFKNDDFNGEMDTVAGGNVDCLQDEEDKALSETEPTTARNPDSYSHLVKFCYALSHHLAKHLQYALRSHAHIHGEMDYESMDFMLIPIFHKKPANKSLAMFQLRGYGSSGQKLIQEVCTFPLSVREDLKAYWQTHYHEYFPEKNEPDEALGGSAL